MTTILIAKPTKYVIADLKRRHCASPPSFRQIVESGPNKCFDNCMSYAFEQRFKCRFTNTNQFRTKSESQQGICNIYAILQSLLDDDNAGELLTVNELSELPFGYALNGSNLRRLIRLNKMDELNKLRKVHTMFYRHRQETGLKYSKTCESFHYCTQWTIDMTEKTKRRESDPQGEHENRTSIHLQRKIGVSLASTLVEIEESLSEPITSFFANLGGVISLYFGFSIMTILAIGSQYLNQCMIKRRKKIAVHTSTMISNQIVKKAVIDHLKSTISQSKKDNEDGQY